MSRNVARAIYYSLWSLGLVSFAVTIQADLEWSKTAQSGRAGEGPSGLRPTISNYLRTAAVR